MGGDRNRPHEVDHKPRPGKHPRPTVGEGIVAELIFTQIAVFTRR